MRKLVTIFCLVILSNIGFAQLEHNQETNDAEGGLIVRNLNNQSIRLWVDSNDTRHIGRGNNSRIVINTDGLIGIGTQTPSNGLLHIYRNLTTGGLGSVNTSNAGLRIQDSGSSLFIDGNTLYTDGNMVLGTLTNSTFSVGTNNVERFRINTDGNVGVGTTDILTRLTIDSDATKFITLKRAGKSKNAHIGYGTANDGGIYIGTDDSQYSLWVQQNGYVGIGTFNPDAKLAVNGTIHTKEVKVDLNGWSDFVFENDYKLRTLEEVEEHINENGHLPEIPSEAEVTENGINLGEMNAKLLQKIEELTLYLIEQNKEIQELKKRGFCPEK